MRKHLLSLSAIVLVMGARDVYAQTRTTSGRVVGSDGTGLPGVTVLVKGTSLGTATDTDGRYSLDATIPGKGSVGAITPINPVYVWPIPATELSTNALMVRN